MLGLQKLYTKSHTEKADDAQIRVGELPLGRPVPVRVQAGWWTLVKHDFFAVVVGETGRAESDCREAQRGISERKAERHSCKHHRFPTGTVT